MNYTGTWGTSSLYLAAAVMAMGAEYTRTDKSNPRRMIFYFKSPEDKTGLDKLFGDYHFNFEDIESAWVNRTLEVNAYAFSESIQTLKSVIHSS